MASTKNAEAADNEKTFVIDIRLFLTVISITMALSFSLGVSFAPISPSNTPDALISDELSYTKRYEGKIKTTRRHAGKHSSYLGNKIDDRGLNEHHVNFDKPSLEDLGRGDGAITHDAPTTAPNSGNIDEEEEHLPAGQHLLVDIKNVEAAFLNSEERLAAAMVEVVTAGGLTLLSYHCHSLIPAGVSCVGVLLESHISFHTWPDEGVITLDMFTCGAAPLLPVVPELKRLFGPPRESKNGTQEEVKAQWSHELRGFRNSEGYKKAGYLDSKSELASMVISPLDVQVKNEILSHSTKYQRVDIWEYLDSDEEVSYKEAKKHNFETNDPRWMTNEAVSPEKWLFLNGQFQISDVEAVEDSEALVHPPMFVHEEPERVAIFNSPDGSILREVLKHDTVEEVVVFEVDKELMELCREHFPEASDCSNIEDSEDSCFDDERTSVIYEDGKKWFVENFPDGKKVKEDDKFDVIEKGGYGDWEDIKFESFNCKHPRRWRELNIDDSIEIPLYRGGLIRVFPNFLTDLRRSVVTDAMERCTLYRQYYTGPGNSCPESHIHVLLSSNSSCKLQEEDASLPLEKCYPGYAYHSVSMKANPLSQVPEVDRLAYDLAGLYRLPENEWNIGADLVVFRDGMDSIAWHSEYCQGEVLILCIVVESQHEPRPILIRPKIKQSELQEGDEEIIIFIDQGDAYEMDGQMQASYEHCLPINRNDLEAKRSVVILRHGVAGLVSTDSGVAVHDCSHKKNVSINVVDNKNPVSKQITSIKSGFPRSGIEEGADIVSMKYLIDTGAHYDHQLEVSGNIQDGCESILLCKLNFELREVDELCWFQYTTERDQGGGALCRSYHEKLPIRVFRSSQLSSQYAPSSLENGNIGYRYDGLYAVKAIYDKNGDETEVYPPAGVKHTFFLTRLPKKSINGFIEPSIYYNSSGLQELWNKIQEKNCIKPEKFEITQPFKKLGPIPEVKESNSVANISVMKRKENAVAQMNKQPRIQENLGKQSNVKKVVPIEEVSKSCIEKDESGSDNIHSNELCKNISIGIIKSSVSELKRNNASERIKQSKPGDKCGSSDCNNIIAIPAPISCMIDRKETNSQSETKKSVACNIKLEIDNNITSGDDCIKNEEHDKQEKGSGKDKAIKLSKNVKNKTTDDENDTDKNFTSIEKSSKRSLVHISTTRKLEKNEFVEQKINEKKKRKLKSKYPLNPSKTSNDDDDGGCGGMWKKSHLNKIKPSSIHMGCRVSVEYKDILYKATVRKSRAKNNSYDFLIHYDGNKKSNVRWIPMSMIHDIYLGDNTENPKIIKANTLKYEISLDEKLLRSQQSLVNHDCKNNGIKKTKTSNNIMEEKSSVAIETQTKAEHIDNNVKTKKLQCHSVDESLQNTYDQSFPLGADVYVEYRSILYSATVRNCRLKGSKVEYLVHYDGYKKTSDKWVEESTLSEINCRTTRRFKKLRTNPTEKNRPPALKKKEEGDADEKMKDSTLSLRKTRSKIGEGIHDRVSNTSVLDMEGFNSGVEFLPGSCIFVNWKNSLHLSKMLKRRKRGKITEYFVHYDGYSTDDEAWVPLSVVYEVNPQTKRIFEKTSDTRNLTHQFTPSSRTRGAASRQVGTSTSISSETNSKCKNRKMSFAQTVDSFRIYSGVEFLPGSMIFAERKNKLHLAKMIKRRGRGDNMEYYIHYDGSKEHTDTWKSILLVYEINPQTKRMFNQQKK